MRKLWLLLAVLITVTFLGCDTDGTGEETKQETNAETNAGTETPPSTDQKTETQVPEDYVQTFYIYVIGSEYAKAIDCYTQSIYGNYALESAAAEILEGICEQLHTDVLQGSADKKTAEIQLAVMDKIVEETNLPFYTYEAVKEEIDDALASKAAFLAGSELQKLENYVDAMKEFSKVLEEDSNYASAMAAVADCTARMKAESFAAAESLASAKKYSEAIDSLKNLLAVLPDDEEVAGKISVYTLTHIRTAIKDAETAFVTADDYGKALEHINAALQFYPEHEELLAKKDYYHSFAPVALASLKQYDTSGTYGPTFLSTEEDPMGNIHKDVFRTWSSSYEYAWVVYILDGKYNKLTFTVYGTEPSDTHLSSASIRDYSKGDYDLSTYIYVDETLKRNVMPFQVEIDVTGVKMIRVYVKHGIAISDAVVQKTVK